MCNNPGLKLDDAKRGEGSTEGSDYMLEYLSNWVGPFIDNFKNCMVKITMDTGFIS